MDDDTIQVDSGGSILNLAGNGTSGVTPLEQEVLDEYERLLRNMNQVSSTASSMLLDYADVVTSIAIKHVVDLIKWSGNSGGSGRPPTARA